MKVNIIANGGVTLGAEIVGMDEFLKAIRGLEWLKVGDGAVHVSQIIAITEVKPSVADISEVGHEAVDSV